MRLYGNFFRVLKLYQGNLVVLTTSFHYMWGNHLDSNLWSNSGHFLFGDGEECLNALSDLSQHMVNAKRILLLRVEICILNTQTVIICSEAYVWVWVWYISQKNFLQTTYILYCTERCGRECRWRQLCQAYPRAVLWKGQKACHYDYASLKNLLIIPVVHVLNVDLNKLGLDSKSTADRNILFFLFSELFAICFLKYPILCPPFEL